MKRWLFAMIAACALAGAGCGDDENGGGAETACEALMDCCDSLDQGQIGACYQVVEADLDQACIDTQDSYAMAGLCPAP